MADQDDSDEGEPVYHNAEAERVFQNAREQAMEETQRWIRAISEDERERPQVYVANRTLTPLEMLQEIEEATAIGRILIDQLSAHRVEQARRQEEIDAEGPQSDD